MYSVNNPNPNRLNELRQAQAYDEASAQLEDICARRVGQGKHYNYTASKILAK